MSNIQLPANVPIDWNYGDIVSPNGIEAGKSEEYGLNYFGEQINAAHRACNALEAKKVNVGVPTIYPIPYITGVINIPEHANGYNKTQNNLVMLNISCKKHDDGTFPQYVTVATLPEGFRPRGLIVTPCFALSANSIVAWPCYANIDTNGNIKFGTNLQGAVITESYRLILSCCFVAQ